MRVEPPASRSILEQRAQDLAGFTIGELAKKHGFRAPADLRRNKGWLGQLLEHCLGASATSKAMPDFPQLAVELKTLPISELGVPQQSTYVCTAPMDVSANATWETSWVKEKLSTVLWVPIVAHKDPAQRMVATPFLWSPTAEQDLALGQDWRELTDLLREGVLWQVQGKRGKFLQIRPKASRASDLKWALDDEGQWIQINPKGFYLRAKFTKELIRLHFA